MRASRIVSGFASWRWTPCCALIAGSLLYVALIVLVVPTSLGELPASPAAAVGPQSDALTADALGRSASHPPHGGSATDTPSPGTPVGLPQARHAPVPPPRHLHELRADALGPPLPPPRPSPAPPPPPAPAAAREAFAHAAPETPEDFAPPEAPGPPIHHIVSGMRMVTPHVIHLPSEQPAAKAINGGSSYGQR